MPKKATRHRPSASRLLLLLVVLLALWSPSSLFVGANRLKFDTFLMPKEDPYNVLGVKDKDRNNIDAIKKAYRGKAKAAHPDKNLDLDTNVANQRFHRIVNAWEFLSNTQHKKRYDDHKRNGGWQKPQQQYQQRQQRQPTTQERAEQQRRQKEQRMQKEQQKRQKEEEERLQKEKLELAKEAQEHVLKISTLEQLIEANVIDETTQRYKKHFLCVFVSNKDIELTAEKDYLFPYPFGPRGRNDIDWGPLIQTAKVRFNKATPLTKTFKVPAHISRPYIVFVHKGALFSSPQFEVYNDTSYSFEMWVLKQLHTKVTVFNRNPEGGPPIKIYFDNANSGILISAGVTVHPGYQLEIPARISDRLIVLDATTNEFIDSNGISKDNRLHLTEAIVDRIAVDDVVVNEEGQTINIGTGYGTTRTCYDLSAKCYSWIHEGKPNTCQNLSSFAHAMCAKTCGVCIDSPYFNGLYYAILHTPPHRIPRGLRTVLPPLREAAKFMGVVGHDFSHIWKVRRNVAVGFFVGGLLAGIQVILLSKMLFAAAFTWQQHERRTTTNNTYSPSLMILGFLVASTGFVASVWLWLSQAPEHEVPSQLKDFRNDLREMQRFSADIVSYLFCLGVGSLVVCKALAHRLFRRHDLQLFHHALFLASTLLVSVAMVVGLTLHLRKDKDRGVEQAYRLYRWNSIWEIRKNVAASIIGVGHLCGATVVAMTTVANHRYSSSIWRMSVKYLFASLANFGVGCGLLSLALMMDKYFLEDLEHVASMRMSAAIPCILVGMLLGLSGAHLCIRTTTKIRYHRDTKSKVD
jgi:curved DNA-binding protein CbpA